MQTNNLNFLQGFDPLIDSPLTYNYQFPSAPAGELLMITETDDLMITETTNDNMETE